MPDSIYPCHNCSQMIPIGVRFIEIGMRVVTPEGYDSAEVDNPWTLCSKKCLRAVIARLGDTGKPPMNPIVSPREFRYKRMCYRNALGHARANPGWRVVHGVVVVANGTTIGHAWCEWHEQDTTWAYDPSSKRPHALPSAEYRKELQASVAIAYTVAAIDNLIATHGHMGPYDPAVSAAPHQHAPRRPGAVQGDLS